jgi:antirestriction protein ArdC
MTKKPTTETRSDLYQTVTDRIIQAIEEGAGQWRMPWHPGKSGPMVPTNAVSGKPYKGLNVLILWASGSTSQTWATYRQWSELGAQVRGGSKGTQIVFFKRLDDRQEDQAEGEEERRRFVARGFTVFSSDQVDGWTPKIEAPTGETALTRIEQAEAFVSATGADIRHGGGKAFYVPTADFIQLPPLNCFVDIEGYYATALHELIHWSGSKSRCDRDLSGRFGSESYAAEELVAELGAAFLSASLGITSEPRQDHAAYVQNWLKVLKGDKRAIFTASSLAQKAADFLHAKQPRAEYEGLDD